MPFSVEDAAQHGEPIDYEREGFDGPAPGNVEPFPKPLFRAPIQDAGAAPKPRVDKQYTGVIKAWIDILSARLLGLIAVVGAVAMFGYAVFDPIPWRTYTVAAYSIVVLWPIVWLYLKKG
jgi:hypothetical protein